MQVQTPPLHCAFGPQGVGVHGSGFDNGTTVIMSREKKRIDYFITRKKIFPSLMENLTWSYGTRGERIAGVIGQTWANRHVIHDTTFGHYAAWAWTGISALLLHASHIGWAFYVDRTFWFTIWRTASVRWWTRTRRYSTYNAAFRKRTTRRWCTRVSHNVIYNGWTRCKLW